MEEDTFEVEQTEEGDLMMTCAARGLRDANNISLPIPLATVLRVSHTLYFSSLAVLGITLNMLVLVLVMWSRKLRNRSFAIAAQIAVANLGVILVATIPTSIQSGFGQPIFGLGQCIVSGYFLHAFVDVRVLLIFAFSLDRFASVFAPFLYPKYNLAFIIFMSALAWFIGIAFNLIGIPQILDCYIYSKPIAACTFSMSCSSNCMIFQSIYLSAVIFPAMAASLIFIIALYIKGRKIRKQTSQMMGTSESGMTERDWKALKTFFLLTVTVIVVNIGLVFVFILYHVSKATVHSPLILLAAFIMIVYYIIDPIVILRNADAREALKSKIKLLTRRQ